MTSDSAKLSTSKTRLHGLQPTLYGAKDGKFLESPVNDLEGCLDANDDIMLAGFRLKVVMFDD